MPNTDGTTWDVASPANSDNISAGALEVRSLRSATAIRMNKEHVTLATGSVGGEHLEGSARVFSGTSNPTKKIDGVTNLDADDTGRLFYNTTQKVLKEWDGSVWNTILGGAIFAVLREQQSDGVAGGTFTSGAWRQRVLTTELSDLDGITAISGGNFTLGAGTWKITANACGYKCGTHRIRILNSTDSVSVTGLPATSDENYSIQTIAHTTGIFTITGTKTFQLQHQCTMTRGTDGMGQNATFGTNEVYAEVVIEKIQR